MVMVSGKTNKNQNSENDSENSKSVKNNIFHSKLHKDFDERVKNKNEMSLSSKFQNKFFARKIEN